MQPLEFTELKVPERSRTYVFPEGEVTIQNVVKICVRPSGNHRLETADGLKHIVKTGWMAIRLDTEEWTF